MTTFKYLVKLLYFFFKFLGYPFVSLLVWALPPAAPQRIVGLFTAFFLGGFVAHFIWNSVPTLEGFIVYAFMQATAIGLLILFNVWGGGFEADPSLRR